MAGSNNGGPNIAGYLKEIDRVDDHLLELRMEYLSNCKGPHAEIREIKASVKEDGVNVKAFAHILRKHRADRRHDKRLAKLDLADLSDYKSMEEALGDFIDTPLGRAAVQRGESGDKPRPEPMF
jgi:hypothetical protein